jgi:plastocyanin domain-containing protein
MRQSRRLIPAACTLLTLVASVACSKSEARPDHAEVAMPATPPGAQSAKVVVDGKGFTPSEITLEKGKPASIVFLRTSDGTCAKEVVFPELKVEKALPLNTPVAIDVPTGEARTLTFQCGMGMYKSAVLVK